MVVLVGWLQRLDLVVERALKPELEGPLPLSPLECQPAMMQRNPFESGHLMGKGLKRVASREVLAVGMKVGAAGDFAGCGHQSPRTYVERCAVLRASYVHLHHPSLLETK